MSSSNALPISIVNTEEFDTVLRNSGLMVCHFYADWVDQCQHMDKILIELANQPEYAGVKFAKVPAEEVVDISHRYSISAVPTILILRRNKEVDRINGSNPAELVSKLKQHINLIKSDKMPATPKEEMPLEEKLKRLTTQSPVMLFMKGNAANPRCGFSRQMIELLNGHQVDYKTFDILTDNEVREGLKKLFNWPTFPQLYIEGELIGGLDVVKDLSSSGELLKMMPKAACTKERLKFLTSKSPVMVFMKGSKEQPRCGFSRQLVSILDATGVPYETFDILEDETVRQELKVYSNWPTYPQVYVNGELIGGLDVIKELQSMNQLLPSLKPNSEKSA
uniref:Glutaredoxin-3 n=1 Tax=Lygus hesperus TaxID=30085 RepID=A0A0A9WZT6_LYGHE